MEYIYNICIYKLIQAEDEEAMGEELGSRVLKMEGESELLQVHPVYLHY